MTPTAKTSTPSQGAQSPSSASELENARSGGTPAALTPATIPNAIRPSCMLAQTSRLEPEIIWPSVSSSTAVVSATPGMKTTREAIIARRPGSVTSYLTARAVSKATAKAARKGISTSSERRPRASSLQHADDSSEHGGGRDVARRRPQDQRDPDRQRRVAEHARQRPVAAPHRPDLLEPRDPVPGSDRPPLRLLGEAMDRCDLVEPRRRRQPPRRLDRRGLAAAERQEERGREGAEARVFEPVGAGDQGKAQLDRVDGLADGAERRAEVGEEEQELVSGLSRSKLLTRGAAYCSGSADGTEIPGPRPASCRPSACASGCGTGSVCVVAAAAAARSIALGGA